MTRKHYRKHKRGGGWLDNLSSLNPFGKKEPSYTPSYTPPPASYTPPPSNESSPMPPMGGKKRRFRRGKRGGSYSSNISHSNLAASAESWTGGKTRKRRKSRHNKSRRR